MLALLDQTATVVLPTPAWVNHRQLCAGAGVRCAEVPYLRDGRASLDGIRRGLAEIPGGTLAATLLQAGCHNTTGLDFADEQWEAVALLHKERGAVCVLDLAYQGLGVSIDADRRPLEILLRHEVPTLLCWSASKNHSLYGLRTGLAAAAAPDEKTRTLLETHYARITRALHSAAPVAGQAIVALVQEKHASAWRAEIDALRARIARKRALLAEHLPSAAPALAGHGLFALLPLSPVALAAAKKEKIFFTPDGRINLAGIPLGRIPELAQKLALAMET